MLDEKTFFHQAMIRICGNLEIEKALMDCFVYLRKFIPMDGMELVLFGSKLGVVKRIAVADASGGKNPVDQVVLLSQIAEEFLENNKGQTCIVCNLPDEDPFCQMLSKAKNMVDVSVILLFLKLDPLDPLPSAGVMVNVAGRDRYTENHARILSLLHDPFTIAMANYKQHQELSRLKEILADNNRDMTREVHKRTEEGISGVLPGLKDVLALSRQIAPRENPVLLMGETGVGKDVIANIIHFSSLRKEGPFIKVNCGAIPENLLDSAFFGHEKGAFTGAVERKRGYFERAHGGTIFLDEIGDLPLYCQTRLLRVLQFKEIERVGGTETIPVNIRVIAATHRNLDEMVKSGDFREDLWFRLNIFPIFIPPLRDRTIDIPALAGYFLKQKSMEMKMKGIPPIAPGAADALMKYPWKGNVRELENVVERALLQHSGGQLTFDHLLVPPGDEKRGSLPPPAGEEKMLTLDQAVSLHIQSALKAAKGKISGPGGAAELLNIHPNTLRNRMDKLGIPCSRKKHAH